MKRFNSALCLNDNQPNEHSGQARASGGRANRCQGQQQAKQAEPSQMGQGRAQEVPKRLALPDGHAGQLLAPDDPVILARHRRPSASDQGSVNVDQQGKRAGPG